MVRIFSEHNIEKKFLLKNVNSDVTVVRHVCPNALVQGHSTIYGTLTASTLSFYAPCHGNFVCGTKNEIVRCEIR